MKYTVNREYLLNVMKEIINTPSPVGYYVELKPVLQRLASELGYAITYDNRQTAFITLEGEDSSKTVMLGAHADTLGFMVRKIDASGTIRFRGLGGGNINSFEGESVTVHTRDGRKYTGLIACQSHSTHVFDDAISLPRNENTLMILLDENVKSKDDVKALGIRNGDYISLDPRFTVTPAGYIKSRYIDDKGAVACCFEMLRYMKENNLKPKYRTILAFPYTEEVGLGGAYVPEGVSEYAAVDIGLIGPDLEGDEYKVSICAKDASAPYDYDLTNRLIECAEKAECDYAVDLFFRYGSDAHAAQRGGNNVAGAAFGMAVYCSHGMERTNVAGLENTVNLMLAYVLGI